MSRIAPRVALLFLLNILCLAGLVISIGVPTANDSGADQTWTSGESVTAQPGGTPIPVETILCGGSKCFEESIEIELTKSPWEYTESEIQALFDTYLQQIASAAHQLQVKATSVRCQTGCQRTIGAVSYSMTYEPIDGENSVCLTDPAFVRESVNVCGECQPSSLVSASGWAQIMALLKVKIDALKTRLDSECPECAKSVEVDPGSNGGFSWGNNPPCPGVGELRPCFEGSIEASCAPHSNPTRWKLKINLKVCAKCNTARSGCCCLPKFEIDCETGTSIRSTGETCSQASNASECTVTACARQVEGGGLYDLRTFPGNVPCDEGDVGRVDAGSFHSGYDCCTGPDLVLGLGDPKPQITWDQCPARVRAPREPIECQSENPPQCAVSAFIEPQIRVKDQALKDHSEAVDHCDAVAEYTSCSVR